MLYHFLFPLAKDHIVFNVFRYVTFRSFMALITALVIALVVGLAGLVVAIFTLTHVEVYEGFLLLIAYWIGPWLGVVFADRVLDKTTTSDLTPFTSTRHVNLAGPIAMAITCDQMPEIDWTYDNPALLLISRLSNILIDGLSE